LEAQYTFLEIERIMTSTCRNCGRAFAYPSKLAQHQRRKTPCTPIIEKVDLPPGVREDPDLEQKKCRFCGRVFATIASMRRHVRKACKIAPNKKNGDAGMDRLYEHTIRRQEVEIAKMRKQMAEMTALMHQLVVNTGGAQAAGEVAIQQTGGAQAAIQQTGGAQAAGEVAIQQTGDGTVAVDNKKVNINISVFGRESLDHVTADRIRGILEESLRTPMLPQAVQGAVLKTAMLVYSDPDHPENLTCYLPNKKMNDALVHTEEGWEVQPIPLVLPPMAQTSIDALFDRQPFEDAATFEPLMAELRASEQEFSTGGLLRPILVRNKDLLARALEQLPVAGAK
jgi:hypothetical protein